MPDSNHAKTTFRQYASQAEGNPGNYWQSDDGEFEIVETGHGFPIPIYGPWLQGAGFLLQRCHVFRRPYSEEHIGHFPTLEAAITAANEVRNED